MLSRIVRCFAFFVVGASLTWSTIAFPHYSSDGDVSISSHNVLTASRVLATVAAVSADVSADAEKKNTDSKDRKQYYQQKKDNCCIALKCCV